MLPSLRPRLFSVGALPAIHVTISVTAAEPEDQGSHHCGVAAEDAVDSGPLPTALTARTVNVCGTPFASPVTVEDMNGGSAGNSISSGDGKTFPGAYGITSYPVTGEPPSSVGGVQVTVRVTVEAEGNDKPVCIADTVSRFFP